MGARLKDTKRAAVSTKGQCAWLTGADCYSLLISDGLVAAVTHAHLKLEAHEGDGGALRRTLAAHGLAALPTVVLSQTQQLECDSCPVQHMVLFLRTHQSAVFFYILLIRGT